MEPDLRDLYQEVIIDHGRHPRHFHRLEHPTGCQAGDNPLCGDQLELCVRLGADGTIEDLAFEGQGCAISMASASLLCDSLRGKRREEAVALFEAFRRLLTSPEPSDEPQLGKLRVLAGVRGFPTRIKCATLAWHTLMGALKQQDEGAAATVVSTE